MSKDQEQVNEKIDSVSSGFKNMFKRFINSLPIPNFLKFSLDQETLKEAVDNAPDKKGNWKRLGLSKTWWAFIPIFAILTALVARFGIDAIYRVINFLIDSWVTVAFLFVGILLLRMLGIWNPILKKIISFLNKSKS